MIEPRVTSSLKTLAKRHNTTIADIRAMAKDVSLAVTYSADLRSWTLDEPASKVAAFNKHLTEALG